MHGLCCSTMVRMQCEHKDLCLVIQSKLATAPKCDRQHSSNRWQQCAPGLDVLSACREKHRPGADGASACICKANGKYLGIAMLVKPW